MTGRNYRQLREVQTGRLVVNRLELADTAWKRSVGLLGRAPLAEDEGLWLAPCNGIHTLFMRCAIDVVFLDRDGVALRLVPNVRPWRICGPVRRARVVIELASGTIARSNLQAGQVYEITPDWR
jgi:uncharacterized protein